MKPRPILIDLNLWHYPIPAIVSLLHRLSGIFLFFLILPLLFLLQRSLESEHNFDLLKSTVSEPWVLFLLWLGICAIVLHFIAGIRHMLMDMHIGESKLGGKIGAIVVLLLSVTAFFSIAFWLWAT